MPWMSKSKGSLSKSCVAMPGVYPRNTSYYASFPCSHDQCATEHNTTGNQSFNISNTRFNNIKYSATRPIVHYNNATSGGNKSQIAAEIIRRRASTCLPTSDMTGGTPSLPGCQNHLQHIVLHSLTTLIARALP